MEPPINTVLETESIYVQRNHNTLQNITNYIVWLREKPLEIVGQVFYEPSLGEWLWQDFSNAPITIIVLNDIIEFMQTLDIPLMESP